MPQTKVASTRSRIAAASDASSDSGATIAARHAARTSVPLATRRAAATSSRVLGSGSTVASDPSVAGQVLSVGKRLSPELFLSFEQSLGGAETLVKLSYQLSRRLSVVARGGTDTSLDLHYGFSFR